MFEPGIRYVGPRHIVVDNNPTPVPFWEPEILFKDKIVVIFGGGPSHVEVDTGILSNCGIFAVNSACRKVLDVAKETDVLYFSDNSWGERYLDLIKSWPGFSVSSNRNAKAKLKDLIYRIDITKLVEFIEIKSDHVYASSGHTAAVLAVMMGAKRLVLIGFECKKINGRSHGHDDYSQESTGAFAQRYIPGWEALKFGFDDLNVEVINSTPDSDVKCFPYLDFEKAVKC